MANNKKKKIQNSKKTEQKKVIKGSTPAKKQGRGSEIFGVCLICFGIIFGIAVYADHSILLLKALYEFAFGCFGVLGYICPVLTALGGVLLIFLRKRENKTLKSILVIFGVLVLMTAIHLCTRSFDYTEKYGEFLKHSYQSCGAQQIGGGVLGALLAWPLCSVIGKAGGVILCICLLMICIMVVFNVSLRDMGEKLGARMAEQRKAAQERRQQAEEDDINFYEQEWEDIPREEPAEEEDEPDPMPQEEIPVIPVRAPEKPQRIRRKDRVNNSYLMEEVGDESYTAPVLREEPADTELKIIGKDLHGKFETSAPAQKAKPKRPQYPQLDLQEKQIPREEEVFPEAPEEEEIFEPEDLYQPKLTEEKQPAPKAKAPRKIDKPYRLPPVSILAQNKGGTDMRSAKNEIEHCSNLLEQTLDSFGVAAKVINAERGPKVTRYELQPAPGVKISKILNLQDDIALNLAAESIRIVAPIPGKAAVGIELPNKEYASVMLRELVEGQEFKRAKGSLVFALGKDIMGQNVYADLKKMPHLLVAGTTGSGKSVCLNTIIMSMLYRSTPDEVKLMMIDPKRGVEMAKYNGLPNLIIPVVIEPAKAAGALQWAVSEMITRYKQFNQYGSKDLESYNDKLLREGKKPLHKLVIVIDEFADLMMISSKEVEDAVCRIAQLGRASGIHLIIATQSPRADIFTGLIKANVPSRIALTVGNALESRIIMDAKGAEQLLGNGDMLFRPVGMSKPVRVQGCWVSDPEIEAVVDFLKENCPADYDESIDAHIEELAEQKNRSEAKNNDDMGGDASFGDDLTKKAIEIAAEYEGVSASMLQRRLRVGYARAARLVDELEALGVVGPADGSKPRQLLLTREDCIRLANADEFLED